MAEKPKRFKVDYYYRRPGTIAGTRTTRSGDVSWHLHGATTESAVLNWLRHLHEGYEIDLMSLDWES